MSDGRRRARLAALLVFAVGPACAEPSVRILDLPFKVREMRGPRSEVAVAVATSGLLPIARADKTMGKEPAPIVLVWGEEGGAILTVENGRVAAKPVGREAVEDLVASETPRGALPGIRRALCFLVLRRFAGALDWSHPSSWARCRRHGRHPVTGRELVLSWEALP